MYSVTKEKSNEKIQKAILYPSLDFKWGHHGPRWGGACTGEFRGCTLTCHSGCGRGATLYLTLASCFIGNTLVLLTLILTPQNKDMERLWCLRIWLVIYYVFLIANAIKRPKPRMNWFYYSKYYLCIQSLMCLIVLCHRAPLLFKTSMSHTGWHVLSLSWTHTL